MEGSYPVVKRSSRDTNVELFRQNSTKIIILSQLLMWTAGDLHYRVTCNYIPSLHHLRNLASVNYYVNIVLLELKQVIGYQ